MKTQELKDELLLEFEKEFKVKFNKNFYTDDFDFTEYQKNIQNFLSQALDQIAEETIRAVCEELGMEKKEIELEEPRLYQPNPTPNEMGGYSSCHFYCSLCQMGEMEIQDNKIDGAYHCRCSVWTNSCGGEWVQWYDKKVALGYAEELPSEENMRNQFIDELNQKIDELLSTIPKTGEK